MFGQPQPQQQNTGFFGSAAPSTSAFGTATTTASSLFGGTATPFSQQQQPQTGSLFGPKPAAQPTFGTFGAATQPSTFGSATGGSLFGSAAPKIGTGTTGGLFGSQPQQTGAGSLFNSAGTNMMQKPMQSIFGSTPQAQTGGGLFGSTQPSFGSPQNMTMQISSAKFAPPTGSDTMQLKGTQQTVTTKNMCISAMKEYESRSLEELRVADYLAGRKQNTSAPQTSSLFGQQQQTTGLFGQKPTTGLFTNPATSTSVFPTATTTTTSLFGTQPTATGTLFGAKPTGSIFGAATTTQPQTSGGLFGQQQPAASGFGGGGGLFGANKPVTSAFGQVSQPSMFGQPQQQSFFGSAAPSTSAFGTATTTTSSIFGGTATPFSQQQPQTGSLFGSKPAAQPSIFGATQQPTFGGPTGGNLFGSTAPKIGTGSIFGSQPQQPAVGSLFAPTGTNLMQKPTQSIFGATPQAQPGGGLFGSAQPTAFGSPQNLMGSPPIMLGSNVDDSRIQQFFIDAQLSALPYGDSPLLKSPLSPRKSQSDIKSLQKQLQLGPNRKAFEELITNPTSNGKLSSESSAVSDQIGGNRDVSTELNGSLLDSNFSYKPMVLLPSVGFGAALGLSQSPKLMKPKNSEKSLLSDKSSFLNRTEEDRKLKSLDMSVVLDQTSFEDRDHHQIVHQETPPQPRTITEVPPLRLDSPPVTNDQFGQSTIMQSTPAQQATSPKVASPTHQGQTSQPISGQVAKPPSKQYRIKLTRPEYYSEPSVEELEEMFNAGVCRIEMGFTVGRFGYGSVFWKGPIELRGPIDLDEIVHFRNKEVVIYPDESKKPDIGCELNRQAEVSLERIWPINPKTKEPIKDSDELRRIGFREKLERLSQRMDATFRDYQPSTGTWQFEVQHFSKYGFHDDEDEPAEMDTSTSAQQQEMKQHAHMQALVQKAKLPLREIQKSLEGKQQKTAAENAQMMANSKRMFADDDEEGGEYTRKEEAMNLDDQSALLLDLNEDTKHFQQEVIRKRFKFDDNFFDSKKLLQAVNDKRDDGHFVRRRPQLVERTPKNLFKGLTAGNISNSILAKAGIPIKHRSARTGFKDGLIFTTLAHGSHLNVVNICKATVIPTIKHYFMRYIGSQDNPTDYFRRFESSELICFEPPSPILRFLDEFVVQSHRAGRENTEDSICQICAIILMKTDTHEEKVIQRTRMGAWLRSQLSDNQPKKSNPFAVIFHHMVNGAVQKAITAAHQSRHYNLALLLSLYQTPNSNLIREQAEKQLSSINKRNADLDYVKIFEVLSGNWTKSKDGSLVGLDRLQVLGLLIWYHASPTTTLLECLDALEDIMDA